MPNIKHLLLLLS